MNVQLIPVELKAWRIIYFILQLKHVNCRKYVRKQHFSRSEKVIVILNRIE